MKSPRHSKKESFKKCCRELLKLIETDAPEEKIQQFLQLHPIFLFQFLPVLLLYKAPILRKYVTDFVVLNLRDVLILIEIERPGLRLLRKDGGITADLQHAIDQVRRWLRVFENHRAAALYTLDPKLHEVARVRGIVIAGRNPEDEGQALLLRSMSWGDIELYTYDDLLLGVTEMIKRM